MHSKTYNFLDILMIFRIHVYQVEPMCRVQEWLLALATLMSYLPLMNFIGESF